MEESKIVQTTPTGTYCKRNRPPPYCTQDHRTIRPPPWSLVLKIFLSSLSWLYHRLKSDGSVQPKSFDEGDDFDFENFPFLDGDVSRSASYGVYISQLIRFARSSRHVDDFSTRTKVLTAKLLRQGIKFCKAFSKFYLRHFDIVSKY